LGLRHAGKRSALRVGAELARGFREALTQRGFVEIFTPKIVGSATEGGANVFPIDYFGRVAFLAQSPQLYKQMLVGVHERVFEVGPVFRAEPHATTRHLNEYISLDIEFGFIESHRDVMAMAQAVIVDTLAIVGEGCKAELELYGASLPVVERYRSSDFARRKKSSCTSLARTAGTSLNLSPSTNAGSVSGRVASTAATSSLSRLSNGEAPVLYHAKRSRPAGQQLFDLLFRAWN